MKNLLFLFPLLFFACKNDPPPSEAPRLTIETETTERTSGQCDRPSAPCAQVTLQAPVVKNGNNQLAAAVAQWANDFFIAMLDPGMQADDELTLAAAIDEFVEMHREAVTEMPDLPNRYEVEVTDTVLLLDTAHLTLRLDAYSNTGGAHPNAYAAMGTFDVKTGRLLGPADFVTDLDKLEKLVEDRFREVRTDDFDGGFEFDESWPFKLADNVGLTTEGLYFCYIPYEVGPYAMGFTEFVIPYPALEPIWK